MPLYEYKCTSCGEHFEVIQKFADEPVSVHEKCGGPVERLISVPSLQFKGSGWYVNDYGKGNSKPPAKSGKSDDSNGSAKSESGKSEPGKSDSGKSDSRKSESGKSESSSSSSSSDSSSGSKPSAPAVASKSDSK